MYSSSVARTRLAVATAAAKRAVRGGGSLRVLATSGGSDKQKPMPEVGNSSKV